ncbi:MAG: BlaI/MecI/CopY family transcriptional regulator [Thermoguttaceae bacterium]|nr:BlaI/MecI/CopY family transcriptional regulator [Thermoguttaceae bacterium]
MKPTSSNETKAAINQISSGETQLLEILWQKGKRTLSQIQSILADENGSPSVQAVQTRINRMIAKGLVQRLPEHPATYQPLVTRKQTRGRFFHLLDEIAGHNLAPLLLHLAKKRELTEDEVQAMQTILAKKRSRWPKDR